MQSVHVIIPTHNRSEELGECLRSLFKMTYSDFHVVVVDDGHFDQTKEVISSFSGSLTHLLAPKNSWWGGCMAFGVKHVLRRLNGQSKNQYIMSFNDDLLVPTDFLEKMVETSLCFPRAILMPTCVDQITGKTISSGARMDWEKGVRYESKKISESGRFLELDMLYGRGTLIPLEAIDRFGNYDDRRFPHYGADSEISVRLKEKNYQLLLDQDLKIYSYTSTTGVENVNRLSHLKPLLMYRVLTSKKSPYNLPKTLRFIHQCCPKKYRLRNYVRSIGKLTKRSYRLAYP